MKRVKSWFLALCALGLATESLAQTSQALIARLGLDGSTADSSGNASSLVSFNGTYVTDRFGVPNCAAHFDGTSQYAYFRVPNLPQGDSARTLAMWIKSDRSGTRPTNEHFSGWGSSGPSQAFGFYIASSNSKLAGYLGYNDNVTNFVADSQWHHVVHVYEGGISRVYVDGSLASSFPVAINTIGGTLFSFGARIATDLGGAARDFFSGAIDDVRIWSRALSANEVVSVFSENVAPSIVSGPTSIAVSQGGSATFSVVAAGVSQLVYQWKKDGISLPGATASVLTFNNTQPWHSGDYSVTISQSSGSVTSAAATLSISGVAPGLWKNLVAYLPFDGDASDRTPFSNNGTVAGRYQYLASGTVGGSLQLSGDGSIYYSYGGYVSLPQLGSYMNSGFTYSLWVKDEVVGTNPVGGGSYVFAGVLDEPMLDINLNNNDSLRPSLNFTLDTGKGGAAHLDAVTLRKDISSLSSYSSSWKHLALTYAPGRLTAYFNGTKVGESVITFTGFPMSRASLGRSWWSGGSGSSARMSATYDNLRIYNRTLSESEVLQLYASEAPSAAPILSVQPTPQVVTEGQSATFAATVAGTSPISYQWKKNDLAIVGATNASFFIQSVKVADAGAYTVTVSNVLGAVTSTPANLTVRSANPGRLFNLSIRTATSSGSGTLIVGFVLGGAGTTGSTSLLTRASGPALTQFGVTGTIGDPVLGVYDGGRLIESNDNWEGAEVAASATSVGAFAFAPLSKDAALLSSLRGASYTSQVFDAGGTNGIALVELYDTSGSFSYTKPRLINISARAIAGTADSTMIAGFVIKGDTPITVLIRGIGPALSQFGVTGFLANPRLTLRRDGNLVTTNDNWGDLGASAMAATMASVGAFALPANSLDSAILATLQPGLYTVELTGANSVPGVALVEIYEVP